MPNRKTVKTGDVNWYPRSDDIRRLYPNYANMSNEEIHNLCTWDRFDHEYLEFVLQSKKDNEDIFDFLIIATCTSDDKLIKMMAENYYRDHISLDRKKILEYSNNITDVNFSSLNIE